MVVATLICTVRPSISVKVKSVIRSIFQPELKCPLVPYQDVRVRTKIPKKRFIHSPLISICACGGCKHVARQSTLKISLTVVDCLSSNGRFAPGILKPSISSTQITSHWGKLFSRVVFNRNSLGFRLKHEVIPIGCFTGSDIVIKKEVFDADLEGHLDEDSTEFEETHIKTEPYQDNNDFLNDHDYLSSQDSNEFIHPMLPLLVIARQKLIWKKKSLSHDTFRLTWSQALENVETRAANKTAMYKNPNHTQEERRPKRRDEETSRIKHTHERKDGLYKSAVRAALKRSLETEEQTRERRLKNALRAAYRRSIETPEQRAERKRKDLLRSARRRREETELQSKIRKYNDAVRAAIRRRNETPEQRAQRKMIDVLRAARRRSVETPEQKEARLKADRERAAKRRFFKKLKIFDREVPEHQEIRYFNLKIMKKEPELVITDTNGAGTTLEDVDATFSKKTKLEEQKDSQCCSTGGLLSDSKFSQTLCAFKGPSFGNDDVVRSAKSVINSEIRNTSPGIADVKGIEGKDKSIHSAFNSRYKRSEIVW